MQIIRTETFDLAYRFATETNLNIFLTGKAGTGKTTFLKYLRENSFKKIVVAAPTGVASINAGGVTLHSLFQLPFAPYIPAANSHTNGEASVNAHSLLSKIRFNSAKLNLLRNLELLVIDEASMLPSHTVDAIDTILKSIRHKHHLPFGGVQILFIGDMYQLPPVVKNNEWQILKDYYSSIFFFDSLALKENPPVFIELKEIFRQRDTRFIDLLNEIRHNTLTQENFNMLNSRLKINHQTAHSEGAVTLTTHNRQADFINELQLQKLNAPLHKFKARITDDFPEHLYPAEYELALKEGAQVMFIKNDSETKRYYNGKTGVITKLDDDFIKVKCKNDDNEIVVNKQVWQNTNYSLNPQTREITENVLGIFEQYPLRLAWAITIHKSQGLTFDKVIIDAENAFANGQVYVALSRCTSLEGLTLTSPINRQFLGAHRNLRDWQEKNQDEKNLPQKFANARQQYVLKELQTSFTWKNWLFELYELKKVLEEYKDELPTESLTWSNEIITKQKGIETVSEKFLKTVSLLCEQNFNVEENDALQQRIKDAANYFSKEILQWKELFCRHPLSTDTRKRARDMDSSLNEINFMVSEILHKLNFCKNGFILNEYLKTAKKFIGPVENMPSTYAQNHTQKITARDLTHAGLYMRLAEMRKHIADATDLPLYQIFSNSAIKNVCESLPANKESLLKVNGFGNAKVSQYGDEIIELVKEYCEDNNLHPQEIVQDKRRNREPKEKSETVTETLKIFRQGKTIEQIASERKLVAGTIEGHLAQAIKKGEVQIEDVIPMEEVNKLIQLFPPSLSDFVSLSPIKEQVPDVSYGKLKMVLSWLQKKSENN